MRIVFLAALIALPAVAPAQTQGVDQSQTTSRAASQSDGQDAQAQTGQPPRRIRSVTLSPNQKCPKSTGDEIVVCQTLDQPYRLPKGFRDATPTAANQSWTSRAAVAEETSRVAGGLPDTCSPVGTGGQSGCALQLNRAYAADRREQANAARRTTP